jgi:hypothetical protein
MNIKRWIAMAGLVVALVGGGMFISSAFAQSDEPSPVPSRQGECDPNGRGERGPAGRLLEVVADTLGLTVEELVEALDDETSIADVADAQGVEVEDVIDAVVAQAEARMQQVVENGRLTQAEADAMLDALRERVTTRINEPGMPERPERPNGRGERGPANGTPPGGGPTNNNG